MRKTLALLFAIALFATLPALAAAPQNGVANAVPAAAEAPAEALEAEAPALDLEELLGTPDPQPASCQKWGSPGSCICPDVYDPVCGCNGVTYSNSCRASCYVTSWTEGACGSHM